ncbi:MAG: DNA polymerase III subunit gamma/tau [Patescibacteria group bacterium]
MTLYLKYRPQTIEQLDSATVRQQLTNLIAADSLPHAFLFSGPKGTGKTSAARILAKVVNCAKNKDKLGEPCNKCESCLTISKGNNFDVIEMDAASNRGIDDVRALKEKIMLSPGMSRKKIYIIDEVHMLTTEAFNALLKTLEEPPAHVIFILATTDPQKLPETVKSRLTNINFAKAKEDEVVRQLTRVAKGEKIEIAKDSLKAISKASGGAFRDSVKNLEQIIMNLKKFDVESVNDYLFKTKLLSANHLLALIIAKDSKSALEAIEKYADGGGSAINLIDEMISLLHVNLLATFGLAQAQEFEIDIQKTQKLVDLLQSAKLTTSSIIVPQMPLEIAILMYANTDTSPKDNIPDQSKKKDLKTEIDFATWMRILTTVRTFSPSVEGFLRAAKLLKCEQGIATIGVHHRFHKEQLEALSNRKILQDVMTDILGTPLKVELVLTIPPQPSLTQVQAPDILEAAKKIFG